MPNNFATNGAQPDKPPKYAPMWTNRFYNGLVTQRNPLRDANSTRIEEKFYGARGDALVDGTNVEISNRLTIIRRYGNTLYNSATFGSVDAFYEFRLFNTNTEAIKVMVDESGGLYEGTGPSTRSLVWTKSAGAGQTFMQYVANTLYFGDGVEQKKWLQTLNTFQTSTPYGLNSLSTFIIDGSGNIQQLINTVVPISSVQVTANVLTITSSQTLTTPLTLGLQVTFSGLATATFLNGKTVTIAGVAGNTFMAGFTYANYGPTADSGLGTVIQGGVPVTGSVAPTWNPTPGGTTISGTSLWVNRSVPSIAGSQVSVMNWGIAAPTTAPTVNVSAVDSSWVSNTFYSPIHVIIDSNGNVQQITTAGISGLLAPAWSTMVGALTTDGTAVWTCVQLAATLAWVSHHAYNPGDFVTATASGTPCLFQMQPFRGWMISGAVTAGVFAPSGTPTLVNQTYPATPAATFTGNSLRFDQDIPITFPLKWTSQDQSGIVTGTTNIAGSVAQSTISLSCSIIVPAAGNYAFNMNHGGGAFFGIDGGASLVSGPTTNAPGQTQTIVNGYPILGANNYVTGGTAILVDSYVVNFPSSGTYHLEIDFNGNVSSSHYEFFCQVNSLTIVTNPALSGPSSPTWSAWSTVFAPTYPSVNDPNGNLRWFNYGPVSDFVWRSSAGFTTVQGVVDPNNNIQGPYETGASGAIQPTWATTINALTNDAPSLIWIEQGPAGAPVPGTITTSAGGWSYALALANTLTQTVSNAGPVTAYTGNFRGVTGVQLSGGLPATIDPQADYVAVFRTRDGGAQWNLIPGPGNTIFTVPLATYLANGYNDTTPDSGLLVTVLAPLALQNTPPPAGLINLTYHLNRIFGSVGNVVYWASGPDSPVGNGQEGFAPLNSATFPSLVTRIVPTSIGAIVFTVSDIYLLAGTGTTSNPLFPYPYAPGIGLLSYNALSLNGTVIYFFSSDSQLLSMEPQAGISEPGFFIGDKLETGNWNPATVYVTWHVSGSQDKALFVGDGSTGWYRLSVSLPPENTVAWSPFATIQGGVKAIQSVEIAPGVHRMLLGPPTSGPILKRDLSTNSDNGVTYTASATIGSIVLAHPGELAAVSFVTTDSLLIGSPPIISIRYDEISGPFQTLSAAGPDPTQLPDSTTLYGKRYYASTPNTNANCRHLQLQVGWPAENAANELLSLTLYGGYNPEL